MDCSPTGSSVPGILHARILEWVAIPFSRGSAQPRDRTRVFCIAGDSLPSKPPLKLCKVREESAPQPRDENRMLALFSKVGSDGTQLQLRILPRGQTELNFMGPLKVREREKQVDLTPAGGAGRVPGSQVPLFPD